MNCCQRIVLALALLSLASVQSGCVESRNWIQVSSNDWPRNPPDLARLTRCSEIEVVIADSSGSVLYGDSPGPGVIIGFVLQEDETDKASLGRIRDCVGRSFADHLQRAFPGKKVSYHTRKPGFSEPRFDSPGCDPDRSAVCLLSYTYIIHTPKTRRRLFQPIWAKSHRMLAGAMAVIESTPPLLLPRVRGYMPGIGWARDKAFWAGGFGSDAQGPPTYSEYPLDCTAEVEVHDNMRWLRPRTLQLNYATLESAMLKWATHRASDVAHQLADATRQTAYGG